MKITIKNKKSMVKKDHNAIVKIQKQLKAEKKVQDTVHSPFTGTPVNSASFGFTLNGLAEGAGRNQRVGAGVTCTDLFFNWSYTNDPSNLSTVGTRCRTLLVYDKATNGVLPPLGQILTIGDTVSYQNIYTYDRFKILYDKVVLIGAGQGGSSPQHGTKMHKKMNLKTCYSGTSNSVSAIQTGGLYIYFVTDSAAPASALILYGTRLLYTDV